MKTILAVLSFILTTQIFAQQGIIKGKVIDKLTGEALIGATVIIDGTTNGAQTDLDGSFSFKAAPGTYSVSCTYIAYQKQTIKELKVTTGTVISLDFALSGDNVELKEIVIEARQKTNTDASLIAIQKKSYAVQDGISAQQITRTGAGNAAESMKQVTGANVDDGKYIVMRGLGDRYSITQLNGVSMASTDPYRNSSSMDIIPSAMIDNIVTLKTFTPDQPANFTGGNVNITTKSFPDKFNLTLGVNGTYNTRSSLNSDFGGQDMGKYGWLGFQDGSRDIPEIWQDKNVSDTFSQSSYTDIRTENPKFDTLRQWFHKAAKAFNNKYTPTQITTPINQGLNFALGNKVKLFNRDFGFNIGLNYSRDYTYYNDGTVGVYQNTNNPELNPYKRLQEIKSVDNPQLGAIVNFGYKFNNNNQITVNNMFTNDAEFVTRQQSGNFIGQVSETRATFNTRTVEMTQRQLLSNQVSGKHIIPALNNMEIEWNVTQNKSKQQEPDIRYMAFTDMTDSVDVLDSNGNYVKKLEKKYYINNAEFDFPYHFFRYLTDDQRQGKIDFTIPFSKNSTNKIKFGTLISRLDRNFEENRFTFNPPNPGRNLNTFNGDLDAFFNDSNFGIIDTNLSARPNRRYSPGFHFINSVNNYNFYKGYQNINSAYVMLIQNVTKDLKFVGGVRFEQTDMYVASRQYELSPQDSLARPGTIKQNDFLPSANLIYALNESMNIRVSYNQTLARPNLREMAPFFQFDTKDGFYNVGNPNLRRTLIQNYDFRYEIFPKPGELIAVSAYYKSFKDPIIRQYNPKATIPELSYYNVSQATVYGLELEFRKNLTFVAPQLKQFYFSGNFTYIFSEVDVPEDEKTTNRIIDPTYDLERRPFQGQAPYIVNTILTYQNDSSGLESSLSFNVSGRKLYSLGYNAAPDIYEVPRPMLNWKISKNLGKYFQASFTARNMLDAVIQKEQVFRGNTYITESYKVGRFFQLGVSYRIK